ncbi:TIGR01777 family oxidoreductase [Botrimarina mediterranea]|uniref:Epimerase family protein n=1 Tax=Botrimarina mediterranea TaxID=2528022 RepID=A0A518KAZ4_9BACT|nr:TIGR01777 family oxidoreductase [Botrimarina mediterranea]QDV74961.1 Epimerase family protein [Botrimarina mediterranea]QDV79606.1 Epimerase family protein [Planctomycetes bacterium K2D]
MKDLQQKRIVIAGGSGFLGTSMAANFARRGAKVTVLSRAKPRVIGTWASTNWDGRNLGDWTTAIDGADAVVNLAGRSVNCIKTPDHQDEILRSRVESTRVLGEAMRTIDSPPPVWVQMSTAHIYGDPPTTVCAEDSAEGIGLAPMVARAWEAAFAASKLPDQRGVILRTSFVIGRNRGAGGGALATLGLLARIGLGGRVGAGTQGMSWIHEADLNNLFARAITDDMMSGVYIASAPNPVSQVEFMRTLRRVIRMPLALPAFEWMVRLGAPVIMRTDPELVLYGRYVVSQRLPNEDFVFQFPMLKPALTNLYHEAR